MPIQQFASKPVLNVNRASNRQTRKAAFFSDSDDDEDFAPPAKKPAAAVKPASPIKK